MPFSICITPSATRFLLSLAAGRALGHTAEAVPAGAFQQGQQGATVPSAAKESPGAWSYPPTSQSGKLQHPWDTPSPNSHLLHEVPTQGGFSLLTSPPELQQVRVGVRIRVKLQRSFPRAALGQGADRASPPLSPSQPQAQGFSCSAQADFSVSSLPSTFVPISISVMSQLQSSLLVPPGGWE